MTKVIILAVFLMWTLSACQTRSRKDKAETLQPALPYDTTTTAVIVWDSRFYALFDSLNHKSATLTKGDIEQVDKALDEIVNDYNGSLEEANVDHKIPMSANNYKRQLVAVTDSNGEKKVWVNCFCSSWEKSWRTQILTETEGGPCFFNFTLYLTRDEVHDLRAYHGFAR